MRSALRVRGPKRSAFPEEYAAFGARWYWLVDPTLRIFETCELGEGARYTRAIAVTDGRIESVPGCPGLALDVAKLWARLDELKADDEA